MTREDIIRMARECSIEPRWMDGDIEHFAALVAAAEREECAKVCDGLKAKTLSAQAGNSDDLSNLMLRQIAELGHAECAAAIRARGQA